MYVRGVKEASLIWESARYLRVILPILRGVARKGFYPTQEYAAKISGTNFIPATREHM